MSKKIKILTIGDHPLSPSGVGTQTRYVCEALLETENFQILSLGGAIKHQDYSQIKVEPYGADWRIIPVDGYGTPELLRSIVRNEKPDIVWFMTDPRFYGWLWQMENEIRPLCPLIYYHVWDNYPHPHYNKLFYESNDRVTTISKLTDDIVKTVAPSVKTKYIPHAVDNDIFKLFPDDAIKALREENFEEGDRDKFIVFWNSRNARRKQSGSLLWWWKEWLDENDLHDKAQLIMHTEPKDSHGQDLEHIVNHLGMVDRQVLFSRAKIQPEGLAAFYNMADATISVSDAEGFGLSTLESLSCGTPIIATVTGGLQDQLFNGDDVCGIPLFPASKAIIGSQQVPYIYEDRLDGSQVKSALSNMYNMGHEERKKLGALGRKHVMQNFSMEKFKDTWVNYITEMYVTEGSWETRKGYNGIRFKEVA
jgi:glycosyltransferase involved in cell wall biosynthesis